MIIKGLLARYKDPFIQLIIILGKGFGVGCGVGCVP
jgi:hypothetical protein